MHRDANSRQSLMEIPAVPRLDFVVAFLEFPETAGNSCLKIIKVCSEADLSAALEIVCNTADLSAELTLSTV